MSFSLGIDIGTSKIAVVVTDPEGNIIGTSTQKSNAALSTKVGFAEQDATKILTSVKETICALDSKIRSRVTSIGLTGQMHGVVLWNKRNEKCSSLITWEDGRCNEGGFLQQLHTKLGNSSLRSGYGCASLAWLAANDVKLLSQFDSAATIHDYIAALLCGDSKHITDTGDAASFGLFNVNTLSWNTELIEKAGIPNSLLPHVIPMGADRGRLAKRLAKEFGLGEGIPITVPCGDNQGSLYSTLRDPSKEIALTLGTGGQLSVIVDLKASIESIPTTMELRPYVGNTFAAVAASLCGGSAFRWLENSVRSWLSELSNANVTQDELYAKLDELGLKSISSPLDVCSSFRGERHDPNMRGSISNIDTNNFTIGNLAASTARSVLENLRDMLPKEYWKDRVRVVGSGNGIRKLKLIQKLVPEVFGMPLVISEDREEAAHGAALLAAIGRS